MNFEQFDEKVRQENLEVYLDELHSLARPEIRLSLEPAEEDRIPLGSTKFGGRPDFPISFQWPFETERSLEPRDSHFGQAPRKELMPLSFVAQIDLADVCGLDEEDLLPPTGILSFFYTPEQDVWGFDPRDYSGFKVLFYDAVQTELQRRDFPDQLDKYARFDACKAIPKREISLPCSNDLIPHFKTDQEYAVYHEKIVGEGLINKMLGYANEIQNPMEIECELTTMGTYTGDASGYQNIRQETELRARDWLLLLQVDSNEDCRMMWGDVGRIYFWIRKEDLLRKQFDKCWLILQCC